MAVLAALDILGTRFERGFEHLLVATGGRRIADQAEPVEAVADRIGRAEIAAILRESEAYVGRGAVAVVGQRLDDQRNAARTEALVADFLIGIRVAARRLVDRAFDIILGQAFLACGDHRRTQARIHVGIGHAGAGRDRDFARKLGEKHRALFVLRTLAVHDVLEFGMAGHRSLLCLVQLRRTGSAQHKRSSWGRGRLQPAAWLTSW